MKFAIILIVAASILVETALVPFPFTLLSMLILAVLGIEESAFLMFIAGILLDFFAFRHVGISSLYFLLSLLILERYSKKVQFQNKIFQLLFLIATTIGYSILFYRAGNIASFLKIIIIGGVFLFIFRSFLNRYKKKRLSL